MINNLTIYKLPVTFAMTAAHLAELLSRQTFTPCGSSDSLSQGWVPPRDYGNLVHTVNGQMLLTFCTEKRLLPASVIKQAASARAAELEDQQGFKPGRKQMKEIKEQVTDELMPRAFCQRKHTSVWIDPVNGWLVIDAGSASTADPVLKLLLKCIDNFPVHALRVKCSPGATMTAWLADDDSAPAGFTVDQDAELQSMGDGKSTVRYLHHTLHADDMSRHIATGKQCTRLALTWNDKISFMLTENLTIKRVTPLDVLKESDATDIKNADDRFDSDMTLMTGELALMLADIVEALGGEVEIEKDDREVVDASFVEPSATVAAHTGDGPDPLYDEAVKIVQLQRRASLSLVQRHLRIGYNHAARLMEEMEVKGVVSKMEANGNRNVLVEAA